MEGAVEAPVQGTVETIKEVVTEGGTSALFRVVGAVILVVVAWYAAKFVRVLVRSAMEKAKIDATLVTFGSHLAYVAVIVFAIIAALPLVGVETASLVGVLAASAFAVGLALQGSLSNFAAGVLLIIFRPFKVGDFIEAAGETGTVEEMQIFTTQITTMDNKAVIIPNAKLTSDNITNYTTKGTRRVDMVMGVSYDDDIDKVRSILSGILEKDERVLDDPEPQIAVLEHGDSSVNFAVRPWVKAEDYWDVYFDTMEAAKKRFDAEGVSIPFPQRDVRVVQQSQA
ncbi:MAG: mechanosensitive ion channel family protein [Planctomycetota bacterium]